MTNDIRETGPQSNEQITKTINEGKFGTKDDRHRWAVRNYSSLSTHGYSTEIKHKKFVDPKVERAFRNDMFYNRFKNVSPDIAKQFNELNDNEWDDLYRTYSSAADLTYAYRGKQSIRNLLYDAFDTTGGSEYAQSFMKPVTIADVTDNSSMINPSYKAAEMKLIAATRYYNDDGTVNEEKKFYEQQALKEIAPELSSYYKEMLNNNNEYLKSDEIDWDYITPSVMRYLENDNVDKASLVFNEYLQGLMWENQNFGERVRNWTGQFVADVALMGVQTAGLFEGMVESIYTLGKEIASGEGVEWEKVGAKLLYDNYLGRWADIQTEAVKEALPLYNDDLWIDPQSAAFTAGMIFPNFGILGLAKIISTVGKGVKATKFANNLNRFTGYSRSIKKAENTLQDALVNTENKYYAKLRRIQQENLNNGKTLKEIRQLQTEALADMYQAGKIGNKQLFLSSALEAQEEARGAKQSTFAQFDQRWAVQKNFLDEQILQGKIDVSNYDYDQSNYENYLNELSKKSQERFNLYKEKYKGIPDRYIWEQVREDIVNEALLRAKGDTYIEEQKAQYYDYANSQSLKAGNITAIENFGVLFVSERFGGITTKMPGFSTARSIASESKGLGAKFKNTWSQFRGMNSSISRMNAQMVFDESTGRFVRRNSAKSMAQKVANVGKVLVIENSQEVVQEGITSGVEGTAENNALDFVVNHMSGDGAEFMSDNHETYLLSFGQHAFHNRGWNDIYKILRNTSAQMIVGTPSFSKYTMRHAPVFRENSSVMAKIVNAANNWLPVNSPTLQALAENVNSTTDVKNFINLYNKVLDESEHIAPSLRYGSASMNYAARSFDAAARNDQTSYEDNLQAARLAEAIFLAQLRGKKNQARIVYYENLRDIDTRRQGETEEQFKQRQATTLQQLREDSPYNSIKNASDDELIQWAKTNGKTMMDLTQKMSTKTEQLYEQFDGNIRWENLYGLLYSDAIHEYAAEQLSNDNAILDQAKEGLTDTELTDEEKKQNAEKKQRLLTESQILALDPVERQSLISMYKNTKGRQKDIIDSLISQLTANATKKGIDNKIEDIFDRTSKRKRIIDENSEIFKTILRSPESFLRQVNSKKLRKELQGALRDVLDILDNKDNYDANNRLVVAARQKLSDKIALIESVLTESVPQQKRGESDAEYEKRVKEMKALRDALDKIGLNTGNKALFMEAINSLLSVQRDAYYDVKNADSKNLELDRLIEKHANEFSPEELQEIRTIRDFLADAVHIAYTDQERAKEFGRMYMYYNNDTELSYADLLDKHLPKFEEWAKQEKEAARRDIIEQMSNPDASHSVKAGGTESNKTNEQSVQDEIKSYKKSIQKSMLELADMNIAIKEELKKQLQEILDKDYNSYEEILLDLAAIDKKGDKDTKKIIQYISNNILKNEAPESEVEPVGDTFTLADITYWLLNSVLKQSAYSDFIRDRNLQNLLRSGKIKNGTEVFVLYDKDFAEKVLAGWKANVGDATFTQAQVPFIAVVKGTIEGYNGSTVTIGDEVYTPISLFRAYGKGTHNSREQVSSLVSKLTGFEFNQEQEFIPSVHQTQILKGVKFTIDHIEKGRDNTNGNSVIHYSENIQKDFQEEDNTPATEEETKTRAKRWFLSRLFIDEEHVTEEGKYPLASVRVENPKTGKEYTSPIFIRRISETLWNGITVTDAIRKKDSKILLENGGNPILSRVANTLKSLAEFNESKYAGIRKVISDFQNGKTENLNGLNKWLNGRGDALGHRLSLPAGFKYYAAYRHDNTTGVGYIDIGYAMSRGGDATANNAEIAERIKDNIFISFEAPRIDENSPIQAVSTQILTDETIMDALNKLFFDSEGNLKTWGKYEFIKWNFDYEDVRRHDGIADEILSELYDMDAFVIQENNPLEVHLRPSQEQIQETSTSERVVDNPNGGVDIDTGVQITGTEEQDTKQTEDENKTCKTNAEIRASMLQLLPIDNLFFDGQESLKQFAQRFKWGGKNMFLQVGVVDELPVVFVGVDELNNMVVVLSDDNFTPANIISIKETFDRYNIPNINDIQFKKYSDISLSSEESSTEENPKDIEIQPSSEETIELEIPIPDFENMDNEELAEYGIYSGQSQDTTNVEDFAVRLLDEFEVILTVLASTDNETLLRIAENAIKKGTTIDELKRLSEEELEQELQCLM